MYIGNKKITYEEIVDKLENKPIYQPELSTYMFYGTNYLKIIDFCINISMKFNFILYKRVGIFLLNG